MYVECVSDMGRSGGCVDDVVVCGGVTRGRVTHMDTNIGCGVGV